MPDSARRNVDDEFLAELLRRKQHTPPKESTKSVVVGTTSPNEQTYRELLRTELGLEDEGSRKRRYPAYLNSGTGSSKRVYTQSQHAKIPRPCTPPSKIIPPYGLFPNHTRASTPPSRVPSLCGSSLPSANTTPEKFPWALHSHKNLSPHLQPGKILPLKKPGVLREVLHISSESDNEDDVVLTREKKPRTQKARHPPSESDHEDDDIKPQSAHESLLTWLDETSDETSLKGTEDVNRNPDEGEDSHGANVSDNETWGESSSSDDDDAVLLPQFQRHLRSAVIDLYLHFWEWRKDGSYRTKGERQETHQSGTTSFLTDTTSSSTQSKRGKSSKSPGKRRRNDDDEDRASKIPRLDSSGEDQDTRLLACPFAKRNPLQHRKCFKYVLQEIARLKQHLLRVHQVPIHCARCSKVFDTAEDRDYHSRQPECIVQPPRTFDGINESQRRQLGKRISSKKSREENWYLIYQILFPEAARPESPYIEDICLSEELLAIREFATQAAPARIAAFANTQLPPNLRSNQQQIELFMQAAVRDVFDMILESWDSSCQSGQSSVENTPHRSTPGGGSSHDSGYSTTGPPSGSSGYSSGGTSGSGVFNDEPVPRPTFEPLPSAQRLDQMTAGLDGSGQWDFDDVFGQFGNAPQDFLFDAQN